MNIIDEPFEIFNKQVKDIICNKCSLSCAIGQNSLKDNYGLINAEVIGYYQSTHLQDLTKYTFSLCEPCLITLFNTFILKPKTSNIDIFGNETSRQNNHTLNSLTTILKLLKQAHEITSFGILNNENSNSHMSLKNSLNSLIEETTSRYDVEIMHKALK